MTFMYSIVCVIFTTLELMCAYDQYFNLHSGKSRGIIASNFAAYNKMSPEEARMVEWYGLWIANNKIIMCLLLLCSAFSPQRWLRCACALSMMSGCLLFFARMSPLLCTLTNTIQFDLNFGIGMFTAMWVGVMYAEAKDAVKTVTARVKTE